MTHTLLTGVTEAEKLVPEWSALFKASAARNVFVHPTWVLTWARHFLKEGDLLVVAVREGSRLVGVAPFRRDCVGWKKGGVSVTRLVPMGSGRHIELNELPTILVGSAAPRAVLRQVVKAVTEQRDMWDWVEVAVAHGQGWFDPEWLMDHGSARSGTLLHAQNRPCVVLPLGPSWPDTFSTLKRHVRRSIRRSTMAMERSGYRSKFVIADSGEMERWVETISKLCKARATVRDKRPHRNYLADPRTRLFITDVGRALVEEGAFLPCSLRVGDEDVAASLVLRGSDELYFSFSAFDPRWWAEGVGTMLMAECLRWGVDHGCTRANLSVGVDNAKLRWSEEIEVHQSFMIVGERRSSRAAFSVYWQIRSGFALRQAQTRGGSLVEGAISRLSRPLVERAS
jgi:CelD/BcsL family acetyltransferase involved in cellulose biosynthesis